MYLFVKEHSRDIPAFVNELMVKEWRVDGTLIQDDLLSELTDEETAFFIYGSRSRYTGADPNVGTRSSSFLHRGCPPGRCAVC